MHVSARKKILYATPTNPSVLAIIIIVARTPFYVVHTINRRSAYRKSLENHRYYLCHVTLQLKLLRTTKDQSAKMFIQIGLARYQ